tara:strand:+ start:52 stop:468 length:417 start_codon:yes stop_codon:yes gene_type:complete
MAKKRIATFLGPQLGLSILGDHCYHYSGLWTSLNEVVVTNFHSPNKNYIVGIFQLNAQVDDDNPSVGGECTANIRMNGSSVAILKASSDSSTGGLPGNNGATQELVIPPGTIVEVTVDTDATELDRFGSIVFTGRVYA